ncbi:lysozyme inhibitor LprI family protein [Mesorhizobium sp. PUT5]|uniref:lysozyme inhibitor LprI family protein n=1 Tax=Mesorhizobium sp. PUT5 TaxID=3454629 RepID=UPI003FA46555
MFRRVFATLVVVLLAPSAQADDKCKNATTTEEISECTGGDLKKLDAELNETYRRIERRLADNHGAKAALISAERAWVTFRDAECKFAASGVEGGSVYASIVLGCTADLTARRVADLRSYLNCEEGDLACPVPATD